MVNANTFLGNKFKSEIVIWEIEQDGMRLNGNGIGFENTFDYRSWMVNEIHQYHSQWTWMVFTV